MGTKKFADTARATALVALGGFASCVTPHKPAGSGGLFDDGLLSRAVSSLSEDTKPDHLLLIFRMLAAVKKNESEEAYKHNLDGFVALYSKQSETVKKRVDTLLDDEIAREKEASEKEHIAAIVGDIRAAVAVGRNR